MKDQLSGIFSGLVSQYVFDIQVAPDHESRQELIDLLGDVASCSDHLSCSVADGEGLQFTIVKDGMPTGIRFRAVPNGHEFTSLLLAILNLDGKGQPQPEQAIAKSARPSVLDRLKAPPVHGTPEKPHKKEMEAR